MRVVVVDVDVSADETWETLTALETRLELTSVRQKNCQAAGSVYAQ